MYMSETYGFQDTDKKGIQTLETGANGDRINAEPQETSPQSLRDHHSGEGGDLDSSIKENNFRAVRLKQGQ